MTTINQTELAQIFDNLKPNQTVRLLMDGPMASHDPEDYGKIERYATLQVGRRSRSKKYNVEKLSLINPHNPEGMKRYLYKRGGKVSLALGDMAACLVDIRPE